VGYHLRMKRAAGEAPISAAEWRAFVKTQSDMEWSTQDWYEQREGKKVVRYYAVLWTGSKYRDEHPGHRSIPFWFICGVVSSPAMAPEDNLHFDAVARALGAQVLGEDGPLDEGMPATSRSAKRSKRRRR